MTYNETDKTFKDMAGENDQLLHIDHVNNTVTITTGEYQRLLNMETNLDAWQEKYAKLEKMKADLQKKYDALNLTKDKVVKTKKYQKIPIKVLAIGSACVEDCEKPRQKYIEDEPKKEIELVDILADMSKLEQFVNRMNRATFSDNFQFEVLLSNASCFGDSVTTDMVHTNIEKVFKEAVRDDDNMYNTVFLYFTGNGTDHGLNYVNHKCYNYGRLFDHILAQL